MASVAYAELHCHTNYSFQEGASWTHELLDKAVELGYEALAITDHDNLCGAMEFSKIAIRKGIHGIIGAELTLDEGNHITLLVENQTGYANLCNLISLAHGCDGTSNWRGQLRREPKIAPSLLYQHHEGLILLTGCRHSAMSRLIAQERSSKAMMLLNEYRNHFGEENVFVEIQQNLVHGDTERNRILASIAQEARLGIVATNNVHYHVQNRHRLNDALVAIKKNLTLYQTHRERRPNSQFYLKSPEEMAELFRWCPEAISNTVRIATRCEFNLKQDLGYSFPDHEVPKGYTPQTWLEYICRDAALRRYGSLGFKHEGKGASKQTVYQRLVEEFALVDRHNLAGFFLIYHDIAKLARDVMIDLGLNDPKIPLEERPVGRGRGSSVAMLIGYLIGISHIDPLKFNLGLSRFIPDDATEGTVPDIDLDFPRNIREELITRVHRYWGPKRAVLTGMISTYKPRGILRDLGRAFAISAGDIDKLVQQVDWRHFDSLGRQMTELPAFRSQMHLPVWREMIDLADQLMHFPKYLAQHPGGMVLSSKSLMNIVPVIPSAMKGRFVCQWDKDSIENAKFVKIDFLSLGTLSQMQDTLALIEDRTGEYIDLSRIDFEDEDVYADLQRADTVGVFQVESAAQMQTITRIKPRNLTEMAYEVAAVRPGVGVNRSVSIFVKRHIEKVEAEKAVEDCRKPIQQSWAYDHPLEVKALDRTLGVILFQDQVNQLAMDVAGLSAIQADRLRRAFKSTFSSQSNREDIQEFRDKFILGAISKGVPRKTALKIFEKFNGEYMFPEAHAFAFGITAYQMSWLKHYYPLEFYVGLYNQQPMGFYSIESIKEDARRHGITVINPDVNMSADISTIHQGQLLVGLSNIIQLGQTLTDRVLRERESGGSFISLEDFMRRTCIKRKPLENLVSAGAFDTLNRDRRELMWEIGLRYRPIGSQPALPLPVGQDMTPLDPLDEWEEMAGEYASMDLYPRGHMMELARNFLPLDVLPADKLGYVENGKEVLVAGRVIRRQHPSGKAIFLTLEDEHGHIPVMMFPNTYRRFRHIIQKPILLVKGIVSRREGTMNIMLTSVLPFDVSVDALPVSKDWH